MELGKLLSNLKHFFIVFYKNLKLYLLVIGLIIIHQLYLNLPCFDFGFQCLPNESFEKIFSIFLSVFGFLLLIISMNSSLKAIHNKGLLKHILSKFPKNPFKDHKITVIGATVNMNMPSFTVRAYASSHPEPKTVDDLYKIMKDQLAQQVSMMEDIKKSILKNMDNQFSNLNTQTSESYRKIDQLRDKIDNISMGSIDYQITGSLAVLYSAFLNL